MCASGGVCRFYLQGNCKFGDRCRNYHPKGEGGRNRHQPPPQNNPRGGKNRFALFSDWDDDDGDSKGGSSGSRDRYGDNRGRSGDYRGGGKDYGGRGGDYRGREGDYGGRGGDYRGRSGDYRGRDDDYGGRSDNYQDDRYHYTSPSYRSSQHGRLESHWRGGGGGTWRGGRSDGRRDYRSNTPSYHSGPGSSDDLVKIVQKDMEESLSMWPLTSYSYNSSAHHITGLPDLVDVSPEELRLEAYKAKNSGSPAEYLKSVEVLVKQQIDLRTKYAALTTDDIKQLENFSPHLSGNQGGGVFGSLASSSSASSIGLDPVRTSVLGSGVSSPSSGLFSSTSSVANNPSGGSLFGGQQQVASAGSSLFGSSAPPSTPGPSLFNSSTAGGMSGPSLFGPSTLLSSVGSSHGSSAPQVTGQDITSSSAQLGASSNSGHLASGSNPSAGLTQEELEAFKADYFVLGKIPEHAPPPELC